MVTAGGPAEAGVALSVIVPVRNEEHNIAALLQSLIGEKIDEIIIVNDGSTDATAERIREFAVLLPHLRLIDAPPLPAGWTGKNHACFTGYKAAKGEILAFIDADVTLAENAAARMTGWLAHKEYGLLSVSPVQRIVGEGERMLLPGLFLSIAASLDFFAINDPASKVALANGQIMFFSRSAYERMGTHAAVAGVVGEDAAIAALIKRLGIKSCFMYDNGSLAAVRMYRSLRECWLGFRKNMSEVLGISTFTGALSHAARTALLGIGAAAVPVALATGLLEGWFFWGGAAVAALWWSMAIGAFRELKVPYRYLLFVPVAFLSTAWLILLNYRLRKTGGRVWKGRRY
jgi:chlorobactene glucosyltransferase